VNEFYIPTPQEIKDARRINRRMSKRITRSMILEMNAAASDTTTSKENDNTNHNSNNTNNTNDANNTNDDGSDDEENVCLFTIEDCIIPTNQLDALRAMSVFHNKIVDVPNPNPNPVSNTNSNPSNTNSKVMEEPAATLVDYPDTQVHYPATQVQVGTQS